jgi:hypothetical protein
LLLTGSEGIPGGAASYIANIAASIDLDLSVPSHFAELHNLDLEQPKKSATAAEKIVWVRNKVSHDFAKLSAQPREIRFQAKQLMARYLELAILRNLKATGNYRNRADPNYAAAAPQKLPWL